MYFQTFPQPGWPSPLLFVAEGEVRSGHDVGVFEFYWVNGSSLFLQNTEDLFVTGYPTPEPFFPTPTIPPWQGTTIVTTLPQGFAYTPGHFSMLDSSPSGGATLWMGCNGFLADFLVNGESQFPGYTSGYGAPGGYAFSSPRAIVGDFNGLIYVADTGGGYIDGFFPVCPSAPPPGPGLYHRWNGSASNYTFKKPVALACDVNSNVYIGDAGYTPSVVEEYSAGGTTLIGQWKLIPNCLLNGLAVDSLGDFYVSDLNNGGQVEEYQIVSSTSVGLVRSWGVPVGSPHEFLPFAPSGIALIQPYQTAVPPTNIIVGDTNNDLLQVFGP
jgi:hypothetical protein